MLSRDHCLLSQHIRWMHVRSFCLMTCLTQNASSSVWQQQYRIFVFRWFESVLFSSIARSTNESSIDRSCVHFFFQWFSDARVHRLIESFIYETILSTVCFYFVFNPKMELNLIMKSVAKWLNGKKTMAIIYRLIVLFRKSTPINTARNTTKYVEWMSANWMWTVSETTTEINQWHKHWWIKESPRLFDIAERSV